MSRTRHTTTAELINSGDLEIGDGYRAKNVELGSAGLPFARAQNLRDGFNFSGADRFPREQLAKVGGKIARPGDSVITTKGSFGRTGFVHAATEPFVYSPQLSFWRVLDTSAICPAYLRYWLSGPEFMVQARAVKGSTDMADYVNLHNQRRMRITLPSIVTQRRIAATLSVYDDLIENNRRRIEVLDEAVRETYREHFSGGASEVDATTIGDVLAEIRDIVHPSAVPSSTPYVGLEHIPRRSVTLMEFGSPEDITSTKLSFQAGDILFGKIRPYFHKVIRTHAAGIASSDAMVLRAKTRELQAYAAALMSSDDVVALAVTTSQGTKMPRASWSVLAKAPAGNYTFESALRFSRLVEPLFQTMANLALASRNLAAQRDLLLPKLISGELDVSELDINTSRIEEQEELWRESTSV